LRTACSLEQLVAGHFEPLELLVVVDVEAVAARGQHQAVIAALHQESSCSRSTSPWSRRASCLRLSIGADHVHGQHDGAGENPDDRDDHEQLEQREAALRRARSPRASPRSQLPMSALMPSPPSWPSAPYEKTSNSPC
jgi:hypothetical protein